MAIRTLQCSFTSGEIAPQLLGRVDDSGYKTGAYKLENFICTPQGSIRSRPGFQYVSRAKDSTKPVRLIPFRFASDQTLILVFGNKTLRILTDGKEVLNPNGTVYEAVTPFAAEELEELDYSQNADVITLTSHYKPPYDLIRYAATDWRFKQVTVSPSIAPPTGITVSAILASRLSEEEQKDAYKLNVQYVVTALDERGYESVGSSVASGSGNFYINGCKIRVGWNGVNGATRYRVYRYVAGIYGYVGETEATYLDDSGDNPDTSMTPPKYKEVFAGETSGIQSINVLNGGSGYFAATSDDGTYLPEYVDILDLPPLWVQGVDVQWSGKKEAHISNVFLDVINGNTNRIIRSYPLNFSFLRELYTNNNANGAGGAHYGSILVLTNSGQGQRVYLNIDTPIPNALFKIRIEGTIKIFGKPSPIADYFSVGGTGPVYDNVWVQLGTYTTTEESGDGSSSIEVTWNINTTNAAFISAFKRNIVDFYKTGFTLDQLISAFGSGGAKAKIPLSISSKTGKDASAYALATNGVITSAVVTKHGSNYDDATITAIGSTGTGATFQPILSKNVLPDLPSAVTQYDQRRVFGGSEKNPLRVWFTNAGYQDLMEYHQPTLSDDRIIVDAVASDTDRIRHLVALDSLLIFTGSSELRVYTQNSDSLSPSSVAVRAQSYIGSAHAQPVILNNQVLFAGNRGGHIYSMGYQNSAGSYVSADISLRATHLFDGHNIKSIALSKAPIQQLWAVTDEGILLGCTLYTDQGVIAWHKHTTDGIFEDVCVVSEGTEDHLYAVIKRDGVRYIERMADITLTHDATKWKYLDCYAEGEFNTATQTVTGLSYLEGKTVGVFADGKSQSNKVVKNGQITLDTAAKKVVVGLPYKCTLITLPLIAQAEASLQGRVKNISELFLRISYDGDIYANCYYAKQLYKIKRNDLYMKPHNQDGFNVKVSCDGSWNEDAQAIIEHRDSAPLEIHSVVLHANIEGESAK